MTMDDVRIRGVLVLGCGKMGSAMLQGWLDDGLPPASVTVQEPRPSEWLLASGVNLNGEPPASPAIALVAVKPQMMAEALPRLAALGSGRTLFVSVAAGTPISYFESVLGHDTPIVRAMPNTPAAVGRGVTAIVGNSKVSETQLDLAERFLKAVGQVVRLEREDQLDAVTGLSGSGPAYVFHLVEAMARAGERQGLPADLSMTLARATVAGAGELLHRAPESAEQLRINVTSPNGTTAAGLEVLMDADTGLEPLMERTVAAAADRSRDLGK